LGVCFFSVAFQLKLTRCAHQKVVFDELIIPDEIHDLLRRNEWVRATAEFFDHKLAASGNENKSPATEE
jgi:hypothetical protein